MSGVISLGAKMAACTAGGMIGIMLGLKSTGWIHGWDHPLAIDLNWWIITAPLWAGLPQAFMYMVGKEIEAQNLGGSQP